EWWQATINTVRQVTADISPDRIKGIGIAGQMHGTVCLGKDGEWVRPAIIWSDTRATDYVANLTSKIQAHPEQFLNISGMPAAGFMAVTLMWLAEHEPQTLEKTHKVLLPKDAMRYKMTGTIGTDYSDASATWLLDVESGTWSAQLTELCGVNSDILPELTQSMDIVGTLTAPAAEQLGLSTHIPVVAGGSDLPVHALGHGLVNNEIGMVTVGTGGQVFMPIHQPIFDPHHRYYTFIHSVKDRWYTQASILSAGSSLRWLRDILGLTTTPDAYKQMSSWAESISPGADGLLFLPYLAGERTPHMDASASGMFFGLRLHHERNHLVRAVMEGVAFALKSCLTLIGNDANHMLLSGGASESTVWSQILADILNVPLAI
ncbi:MAG: xylulokinase, partial [Anaerolineae bacterium]|nr:xylulokinase [Anaerolineae bacterium]